jgi:hypothetical protein
MRHCLNKEEINFLLDNNWEITEDVSNDLILLLESCKEWHVELICLTYLLSKVLEQKTKDGIECGKILMQAMAITNKMWLSYQYFDLNFVKYLFRHVRQKEIDLENNLIEIQNRFSEHIYD